MEKLELIAPCHFGLESVLKREVLDLGYEISAVEDGRVFGEMHRQYVMLMYFLGRRSEYC